MKHAAFERSHLRTTVVRLALLLASLLAGPALAANYAVETYPIPGEISSAGGTGFFDINAGGQIVGTYFDGEYHGFLREPDGSMRSFQMPPGVGTLLSAVGINDAGEIVGWYIDRKVHGYLRRADGTIDTIAVDGAVHTAASAINNLGSIVGTYTTGASGPFGITVAHSFVRNPLGEYATISVPGAVYTRAYDINDRGQIAGTYADSNGHRGGFVTDGTGQFTLFDADDSLSDPLHVSSIDEAGRIIGVADQPVFRDGSSLAEASVFIREPDGTIDIMILPGTVPTDSYYVGINANGVIVGTLTMPNAPTNPQEVLYGFIASPIQPVPLPATLGLFAIALAGLGGWRARGG